MKTVTYKNYTVTKLESGTIEATRGGHIISPTLPLLRELAQELNVSIENASGNLHITRQLGVLVMRAIEENQLNLNSTSCRDTDTLNPINSAKELENTTSNNSFINKIKQTINKIQKPAILKIEDLIEDYLHENKYGIFYLDQGEKIEKVLVENTVPNEYGVYIIYSVKDDQEELIYIGKAGTIATNGDFKRQGIKDRLKAVTTNNMQRGKYFQQEVIQKYGFDKLKFVWIVTFDDTRRELPAYGEARLMQLYYDTYDELPMLNKSF